MKRYLRVLPALALATWLLAACGDNATPTQPATTSVTTTTAPATTSSSVTTSAATTSLATTAATTTVANSTTSAATTAASTTTSAATTSATTISAVTTVAQATTGATGAKQTTTAAATSPATTVSSGTTAANTTTATPVIGGQVGTTSGDLPVFSNLKPVTFPAEFTRLFEQYFTQNFKAANAASATHQFKYYSNTNSPQTVEKFYDAELGKLGYTKSPADLKTGVKLASLNLNIYNLTYTKRNGSADQIVTVDSLGPITDENLTYFASSNLPDGSTIIVVDQAVVPHS